MEKWQFSSRDDEVEIGIGGNTLGNFTNDLFFNLARETIQNSMDAKLLSSNEPVRVVFSKVDIPRKDIPGIGSLTTELQGCLEQVKQKNATPAIAYFEHGLKEIKKSKIACLKISDFGTTGMTGPYEPGFDFHSYMKGIGQGGKTKANGLAGGSHGLGKVTVEGVSAIKSQFVVSKWVRESTGEEGSFFQGRTTLISRKSSNGTMLNPEGYLGDENYAAVTDTQLFPNWAARDGSGSDIYVLAFRLREYYPMALRGAVIQNFFQAILMGKLEVEVLGQQIDKTNLYKLATNEDIRPHLKEIKDQPSDFDKTRYIVDCMRSERAKVFDTEDIAFGHCRLRVLKEEGAPQVVCFLRNGMLITTQQRKLKTFPNFSDFIAVFECLNDKGLEYLRSLEPPAHDCFDFEQLYDETQKKKAKRDLENLSNWIRNKIKEVAQKELQTRTRVDWVAKMFPSGDESPIDGATNPEINPEGEIKIEFKPAKLPQRVVNTPTIGQDEDNTDDDDEIPVPPDPGPNPPGPNPPGPNPPGPNPPGPVPGPKDDRLLGQEVTLESVRHRDGEGKRIILYFTPSKTGNIALQVQQMGADAASTYQLSSAERDEDALELLNGNTCVLMGVEQNKRAVLTVELKNYDGSALRITANEV